MPMTKVPEKGAEQGIASPYPHLKDPSRPKEGDWVEFAPHVKPHGCLQAGQRGQVMKDVSYDAPTSSLTYLVQAPQGKPTWYSARDLAVVQWPPPPPSHTVSEAPHPLPEAQQEICVRANQQPAVAEKSAALQFSLTETNDAIVLAIELPMVSKVAELVLDVEEHSVAVAPADGASHFAPLTVPLPAAIDDGAAGAKWDKKKRTLRVTLPRKEPVDNVPTAPSPRVPAQPPAPAAPAPIPAPHTEPSVAPSKSTASPTHADPTEPDAADLSQKEAATATAEEGIASVADSTEAGFAACTSWEGERKGWYFASESLGLGYYRDWRGLDKLPGGFELGQRIYATRDIQVDGVVAVREGDVGCVRGKGKSKDRLRILWEERRDESSQRWAAMLGQADACMDCAASSVCPHLLAPGARVCVDGLTGRTEINGKEGVIESRNGDRWCVRFDDRSIGGKALRRANLIILKGAQDVC